MLKSVAVYLLLLLTASAALARPQYFPEASPDGLQLVPQTQLRAFYLKPGADLRRYNKIALMETHVSFASQWQSEENAQAIPQNRISDAEMLHLRDTVAREFNQEMTRVLSREEGRQLVSTGGTGVLVLHPSIVDLEITVDDLSVPRMNQPLHASAASMMLILELYDGRTGDIVARIYDAEGTDDTRVADFSNGVTLSDAFERIVQHWAAVLNSHLSRLSNPE